MAGNTVPDRCKRLPVVEECVNLPGADDFVRRTAIPSASTGSNPNSERDGSSTMVECHCRILAGPAFEDRVPSSMRSPSLAWPTASCAKTPASSGSRTACIFPPFAAPASSRATAVSAAFLPLSSRCRRLKPCMDDPVHSPSGQSRSAQRPPSRKIPTGRSHRSIRCRSCP